MSLARVKTWIREVLTFQDLNAEFNNVLNNSLALISPLTGDLAAGGNDLTGLDELALNDAAANASVAGRIRRNATNLSWHDGTAARNVSVIPTTDLRLGMVTHALSDAEVTTVATSETDLKTITTSIGVGEGLLLLANLRKTAGAATAARVGLKLNTAAVRTQQNWSTALNQAESGLVMALVWQRDATYLFGGFMFVLAGAVGGGTITTPVWYPFDTTAIPNATITSVIITGSVGNAAITMGVQDAVVYRLLTASL